MISFKKVIGYLALITLFLCSSQQVEAVTYVTDTGGYAYDEARATTNLAPAIALGTLAIVGIVAIAVQNSHHRHHDHSSGYSSHYGSYSSSSSSNGGYAHQ